MAGNTPLADLPVLSEPVGSVYVDEKKQHSDSVDDVDRKAESSYDKDSSLEALTDREGVLFVNGEPVIRNGEDVSNFLFDIRDDGDPALTFRSMVLGTVFAALGAAMCQASVAFEHTVPSTDHHEDLPVQTRTSYRLNGVLTVAHLHRWQCMGGSSSSSNLGRRHPFCSVGTSLTVHQPRRVQA